MLGCARVAGVGDRQAVVTLQPGLGGDMLSEETGPYRARAAAGCAVCRNLDPSLHHKFCDLDDARSSMCGA